MASRTQMRLAQITGSFGTDPGQISDQRPSQEAASAAALVLSSGSLLGPLSEMASAIKRIHGAGQFAAASEGKFFTNITFSENDVQTVGNASENLAAVHTRLLASNAALALTSATTAGDIAITSAHTAGDAILISANAAAGSILDIDAGIMDVDVQGVYTLNASGVTIASAAASSLSTSSGDLAISSFAELDLDGATVALDSAGVMDITSVGAMNLISAAYDVNASGVVGIDSADAMTLGGVSITATAATGDASFIASAGKVILSGSSAGDSVHVQSELTVLGAAIFDSNVIIAGNLDVNGTVSTIDTVNMTVKDRLVGLNYDGGAEQALADIGFVFGNSGGEQKAFIWDNSGVEFAVMSTLNNAEDSELTPASYSKLHIGELDADGVANIAGLLTLQAGMSADNFSVEDTTGNTVIGGTLGAGASTLASVAVTGASTLNGDVDLGNATGDDIRFLGDVLGNINLTGQNAGGNLITLDIPDASSARTIAVPDAGGVFAVAADANSGVQLSAAGNISIDIDSATDHNSITLVGTDQLLLSDGGTEGRILMSQVLTYVNSNSSVKHVEIVTGGPIVAGTALDVGAFAGFDGALWHAADVNQQEVYCNGQLLARGANSAAGMDWYKHASNSGEIKFGFDLEDDDVLQFVLRG